MNKNKIYCTAFDKFSPLNPGWVWLAMWLAAPAMCMASIDVAPMVAPAHETCTAVCPETLQLQTRSYKQDFLSRGIPRFYALDLEPKRGLGDVSVRVIYHKCVLYF